jgi:hypothetical protein
MRQTYKVLAHTIAGLVVIQAAAIALAMFGLLHWVGEDKKTLTPTIVNDQSADFPGSVGFEIHSLGAMAIALVAIILLIVSFFAKFDGAVKWAGFVFLAVLLQWVFAFVAFGAPYAGLLHGANALVVFSVALMAGRRASAIRANTAPADEVAATR